MKKLLTSISVVSLGIAGIPTAISYGIDGKDQVQNEDKLDDNKLELVSSSDKVETYKYKLNKTGANEFFYNSSTAVGSPSFSYKYYEIKTDFDVPSIIDKNVSIKVSNNFQGGKKSSQVTWGGDVFYPWSAFAKRDYTENKGLSLIYPLWPSDWVEDSLKRIATHEWADGLAVLDYREYSALGYYPDWYDEGKIRLVWYVGSYINPKWSLSNARSWTNIGNELEFKFTHQ
ncbi:hypothetical protein CXP39_02975 [Mesoplasma syrphidae]|uniref:Uncharacterized protein n=1 Tax=Mesoplasma syrphidae TaxID=225999 RepID=A0A2K9BZF7_9MOLU|nr:hypothetical protein [Mesoplasma syrphidae]AUF83748.1 hypothetical protein CXP39_02975 [Mesoplasma syrphidae]